MRRAVVTIVLFVAVLLAGCTASDRDYVRNHIVLLQRSAATNLVAANLAEASYGEQVGQ